MDGTARGRHTVLRQKQEHKETESEVSRVRRKWGWFEERKTDTPPSARIEAETGELEARLAALQTTISRHERCAHWSKAGVGLYLSGFALMLIPEMTNRREYILVGVPLGGALLISSIALGTAPVWYGYRADRKAVTSVANTDNLRAIGTLAEALTLREPYYAIIVSTLTRLLPRLQPADVELLNEKQIVALHHALRQSSNRTRFWRYNPHFASVLRRALTTLNALPPTKQAAGPECTEQLSMDVDTLLKQFQAAVRRRQKNMVAIGTTAALAAASAVGNIAVQALTHQQSNTPLLGIAIGSMALMMAFTLRGLSRLKAIMHELSYGDDLRIVGPLLEITEIQDGTVNTMAFLVLTRLLPHLKAGDATLLTEGQHVALGRTLTRDTLLHNQRSADFLVAVLAALEQVGDGRALPMVESLAAGRIVTAEPKRVQAAAQECLPYLQTRYEQQQASQTLLRASALSETPSNTLLRPAQGVGATEAVEMLRPGTPRSENEGPETSREFTSLLPTFSCPPAMVA